MVKNQQEQQPQQQQRQQQKLDNAFALLSLAMRLEERSGSISSSKNFNNTNNDNNNNDDDHDANCLQAACNKYLEACNLFEQYLSWTKSSSSSSSSASASSSRHDDNDEKKVRDLIVDKMNHYRAHAETLNKKRCGGGGGGSGGSKSITTNNGSTNNNNNNSNKSLLHEHHLVPTIQSPPTIFERSNGSTRIIRSSSYSNASAPPIWEVNVMELSGRANKILSRAIDMDERRSSSGGSGSSNIMMIKVDDIIQEYMSAAKLFLDALKVVEDATTTSSSSSSSSGIATTSGSTTSSSSTGMMLKKRLEHIMDRVEQLKSPKSATRKVSNYAKLNQTMKQQQQQRSTNSRSGKYQQQVSSSSSSVVGRRGDNNNNNKQQKGSSSGSLTDEEIAVLKRSSLISSGLFLPWLDDEVNKFDFTTLNGKPFIDPDGLLKLSKSQKKHFYKWARPIEIASMKGLKSSSSSSSSCSSIVMVKDISPYSIKQKDVTDCSFIASLCICAAHEKRFHRRLVTTMIYPQDNEGNPIYNKYGKYLIKLWLNGVARVVVVDDLLPVDNFGNLLCSHTTTTRSTRNHNNNDDVLELWVSIIEKAYMKLCGGYDFPGSNSGVDLFSLTGWIPERIFIAEDEETTTTTGGGGKKIRDYETPRERAWERLYNASNLGDCLITASTSSKMLEMDANTIGLVTGHAYAVLNVIKTSCGKRLLQLKNPWAHKGWKGKYSCHDEQSWYNNNSQLQNELGYNVNEAKKYDDGIFWIHWDDVLLYFTNIHLSWNPSLFESKMTVHGYWPKNLGPIDDSFNYSENPQYILTLSDVAITKQASIWILLSRHVAKQEQEGMEASDYLTLHIYRNKSNKKQIVYPGGKDCLLTGAYTNNPHVLVRYDVTNKDDKYLSLVLSQYKKKNDLGYSLSCYCTSPFILGKPVQTPPHQIVLESEWNNESAGGNASLSTFKRNPMWSVYVPNGGGFIQLKCCCSSSNNTMMKSNGGSTSTSTSSYINAMLIKASSSSSSSSSSGGGGAQQQVVERSRLLVTDQSIVIDTGDYRQGFVCTGVEYIPAGLYALVPSTFVKGQIGNFILTICRSTKLITVNPVLT